MTRPDIVRVLFATHSDKKGGAEQSLIHLINYLDPARHKVFLLCPADTSFLNEIRVPFEHVPIKLDSVKTKLGWRYLANVWKIGVFVRSRGIDIVHANGWRAPWFAGPLRLLTSAKLIWHNRDHHESGMYTKVLPVLFDRVICISRFVQRSLHSGRTSVVYNGVDRLTEVTKTRTFMEDGVLLLGMFGRIVEWKRYDYAIEALHHLGARGIRNCRLLIVGDTAVDGSASYYEELRRKVEAYGLAEQVVFYGYTDRPVELMSKCDITINFSRNEPFGRVIIESMLAQTPVIVSDSGGAPEIVELTGGGLVVEDGNAEQLAACIERWINGQVPHRELAEQGHRNVLEHCDMRGVARQVEDIYEQLLGVGAQKQLVHEARDQA
ncbi:glycosyltransferase family 4 protein [Paenibacillus kobensis]|uniref:glycosyltransferase family 4 protein n=1 Tax=Paenibacillus kobensis TaxID=59841 RepID=UPI000FDB0A58|nr:glycosyltransferase family 4 protein [Paenibacillus kobensis]